MKTNFTEMTDSQWQFVEKIIDNKRSRKHSLRTIVNAILWLNETGVQWRNIDSKYPAWQTIYYHFRQFKLRGIWTQLLECIAIKERKRQNRNETPSLLAIDSQCVKKMQFINLETGIDGGKKINGRKRTILVDTIGIPWSIKVTSANVSDNQAGIQAVENLRGKVPDLQKITADNGYKITFIDYVIKEYKWEVEIAQKPESAQGFIPQKNRWQVERSFGWLNFKRRLFRDVEKTVESAEAMLEIAYLSIFLNRITK
ncbi:IS5 family transposase [Dyadobacter frigoris]|uniref:IS5 family transposase n=5 Tax=Dyadobacter frigoris TaxID=2576211 RepID=A0A4U6CI97_9BACT|nr:IS5 family transposase [Dyadobacter frigoris]TKT83820.1 IS5 family transposase [Dyadobacter frigoris]GLU57480.1 IS5 family transposase [Dyadobacter frigoris]